MIASPVITPASGANHHIEVLAIIPANVPGSMTATVMTFLLGITHDGPTVAPSSPARRIATVTRLPRAAPL
jgi:hypothetical protein